MSLTRSALFAGGLFVAAALAGFGCKDDSGNGVGNPGTGGSTAGSGGGPGTAGTGGGAAGAVGSGGSGGGTPGFMSILPCAAESAYMTGTTTINFGLIGAALTYDPKCLKVPAGSTVTFSGDFTLHPLIPSALRGAQTGSPITSTSAVPDGGTTKSFTFTTPGFFAYYCATHDSSDTGNFMSGVVWVVQQ